jgi:hypothetical protein
MPRGISLHVGINRTSSTFASASTLSGAENDAREMDLIAAAKGFAPHDLLLGSEATYAVVTSKIRAAADTLEAGDIFLFTFAGHGFQKPDNDFDETDDFSDETILLYDMHLVDDVFRKDLLPSFKDGVRVLGISDSCHSQTIFAGPPPDLDDDVGPLDGVLDGNLSVIPEIPRFTPGGALARTISDVTASQHFEEHRAFYENTYVPFFKPIRASVLLLAACLASETTGDGDPNGAYTAAMLKVLRYSDPADYKTLVTSIAAELPWQNPTYEPFGTLIGFEDQEPFLI